MGLILSQYKNAEQFLAQTGKILYSRASANNLMLGICERLVRDPEAYECPFYFTVMDEDDKLLIGAVMTPPHNLVLAGNIGFKAALPDLVDYLLEEHIPVPGVIGPVDLSEAFTRVWEQKTGDNSTVGMYQRVYELRHVRLPEMPPGHFRTAGLEDLQIIATWFRAFEKEALSETHDLNVERAQQFIEKGKSFVWERDGKPVSMALKTRPMAHSITVSGVYTPPENRRQGYATALVARLSQHLLELGFDFINLFTDLENPTSNAIYQKIGYHPICDFRMYKFIKENDG